MLTVFLFFSCVIPYSVEAPFQSHGNRLRGFLPYLLFGKKHISDSHGSISKVT